MPSDIEEDRWRSRAEASVSKASGYNASHYSDETKKAQKRRTSKACSSNALDDGEPSVSSNTHWTLRGVLWPERRVPPGGLLSAGAVGSEGFMCGGESMAESFDEEGVGERRMLAMDGT